VSDDESDPFEHAPRTENRNTASGDAHVDQQIGENYGYVYHESTTYHLDPGDPPERRHTVALNHLEAGTPEFAEPLFDALLREGYGSGERAYYYVLSLLSGRSWHDLRGELVMKIKNARKTSESFIRDHWLEALDVVWRLLDQMRHELDEATDVEPSPDALNTLDELPLNRQEEISRHLDAILDGVAGEQLDAVNTRHVVLQRLGKRRRERAWLFFEPDPAKPRQDLLTPVTPERSDWVHALAGGAGVVIGMMVLLVGSFGLGSALGTVTLAGAGYLLLRYGIDRATLTLCVEAERREAEPPDAPVVPRSPGHWVRTDFVQEIHRLVDARFSEVRPHIAGNWPSYTEITRAHLKKRLVDRYGNAQVKARELDWLIRWHARCMAAGWDQDASDYESTTTPWFTRTDALCYLGTLVAAAGLTTLMLASQWLAAALLGAGGTSAIRGIVRIGSLRGLNIFLRDQAKSRHDEEISAYNEWMTELADRPSDPEMARWLEMDKIYLRTDVAKRAGLTTHDLVMHVVTAEGTKNSVRTQVTKGPLRYSTYQVQIFLLTRSGVREVKVELNFLTGEVRNERRNLFRYDALASAQVTERGVRTTRSGGHLPVDVVRLRSRTLRLTLLNGHDIAVLGENFRRNPETLLEDEEENQALSTLQSAGVEGAMPILESVASEGADWIAKEHERRQRWARDWGD
jgi:hypothetical protein